EAALGVDEEVAARDDRLALGETGEDLHALAGPESEAHRARLEAAALLGHEHVLRQAGVHDRLPRDDERLERLRVEDDGAVHAGPQAQLTVLELNARAQRAGVGAHRRVGEGYLPR